MEAVMEVLGIVAILIIGGIGYGIGRYDGIRNEIIKSSDGTPFCVSAKEEWHDKTVEHKRCWKVVEIQP
jgi:hypothetical protein